jgi:hypothetical protein
MRTHVLLFCLALGVGIGCRTPEPHVPLPRVTQFDDDRQYRATYLYAFKLGYLDAKKTGMRSMVDCVMGPDERSNDAFKAGINDGSEAALRTP